MYTLAQHLEEYRQKQKDFPTYAELLEYVRQYEEQLKQLKQN